MATVLAARLYQAAESEVDDEMRQSSLGELVNMVGGSFKSLLPGSIVNNQVAVEHGDETMLVTFLVLKPDQT